MAHILDKPFTRARPRGRSAAPWRRREGVLIGVILFIGCTSLQEAPEDFDLPIAETVATPPQPEPLPPGRPIRSMEPVETLADCWAVALALDPAMDALRSEAEAFGHEIRAARGQSWPTASVSGLYGVRSNEPSILLPPLVPGGMETFVPYAPLDQVVLRGQVALPIYTGHRIENEIEAAKARATAQEYKRTRQRLDLKLQVAEEYLAVLRAEHELAAAESQLENLTVHRRDIGLLASRGSASRRDVLEADAALADTRYQALLAQQALDLWRATFNQRLGRPLEAPLRLAPLATPAADFDLQVSTARALAQSPETSELRARAAALRCEAHILRSQNRPQVQILGAYTYAENPFQDPQGLAEAALGVNWNLFDGGAGRHTAMAREQSANAAARWSDDVAARIELDVRKAWLQVQASRQRLSATQQALELAEEAMRGAYLKLTSGVANTGEVLDREAQRMRAVRNHHAAQHDAVLAHFRLLHAIGDL